MDHIVHKTQDLSDEAEMMTFIVKKCTRSWAYPNKAGIPEGADVVLDGEADGLEISLRFANCRTKVVLKDKALVQMVNFRDRRQLLKALELLHDVASPGPTPLAKQDEPTTLQQGTIQSVAFRIAQNGS